MGKSEWADRVGKYSKSNRCGQEGVDKRGVDVVEWAIRGYVKASG